MIQTMIKRKVWLCIFCLSLLTVSYTVAIAVFVLDAKADEATREAVIAKVSKVAWDELNK
ncbi:MAG: hypothetical protein RLZZ535_221 [Cyanobacteriota bacterium]|jgi:hypothetical protein